MLATFGCTMGFAYLSYSTFDDYMRGRTMVVKSMEPLELHEQTKMSPVVIICSKKPFADTMQDMSTVQSYIDNTIDVSSTLIQDYYIFSFKNSSVRLFLCTGNPSILTCLTNFPAICVYRLSPIKAFGSKRKCSLTLMEDVFLLNCN